jgi:hypothetical protein
MRKRLVILALLLIVMSPIPGQTANNPAGGGGKVQKQQGNGKNNGQSAASPLPQNGARPASQDAEKPDTKNTGNSVTVSKLPPVSIGKDWADWSYWGFGGILVVVGSFQVWFLYGTLRAIQTQAGHMERQTKILEDSVAAAQKTANAAEKSAIAAIGVAVPTLMLSEFEFIPRTDQSLQKSLEWPTIMIAVKNYGQSPAIMRSFAVEFTCEDPPADPRYPSLLHFDSGTSVEAGKVLRLEEGGVSAWGGFTKETAELIAQGSKALTVYGCVWYDDVFGSPTHTLTFSKWRAEFLPDGINVTWIDSDLGERYEATTKEQQRQKAN